MPSVSYPPQDDAEAAQVARLKVILGAELPRRLADRTIPCKMVFGSQGCTVKAGQPLTISFMFPEEYMPYISASLESCITYTAASETDQPVAAFQTAAGDEGQPSTAATPAYTARRQANSTRGR